MPRSYDLNPVSITHHPTQRIDTAIGKLPPFDIQQIVDGFLTALKDLTGIDLTGIRDFLENMFGSIDWSNLPDAGDVWQFVVSTFIQPIIDVVGAIGDGLNAILGPIFAGLDFNDLPSPAEVWQTVINTIMLPLNLLLGPSSPLNALNIFGRLSLPQFGGGVPLMALTTAVPNELEPFSATSVPSSDGWSWNATESAAQVVADGSTKTLYLSSGVIKVEEGQPINTTIPVKYTGVSSGVGQSIRYVLETFTSDDGSGTATPVTVQAISNPSGSITTPVTLGDTSWDIPAGVQSVRPALVQDLSAGTVFWKNTPQFKRILAGPLAGGLPAAIQDRIDDLQATWDKFKGGVGGTVDDIDDALDNAGQAIRDAIANALGHAGTGHTAADILSYLQNIPKTVVDGLEDFWDAITAKTVNITSGGLFDAGKLSNITGTLSQSLVTGLTDLATQTNQIVEILAGNAVTAINATVQAVKDWFAQWFGGGSSNAIPLSQKGANNGVATLDSSGNVPLSQLGNVPGVGDDTPVPNEHILFTLSANQSISSGTATALTGWQQTGSVTATFDDGTNTRWAFPKAGWWDVQSQVVWQSSTTGKRQSAMKRTLTSGSVIPAIDGVDAADFPSWGVRNSVRATQEVATRGSLAVTDKFSIEAYQNSGGALNVVSGYPDGTYVLATYFGQRESEFVAFTETNVARTNQPVPDGAEGCWVTLVGAGGGGGGGMFASSSPFGGAGGGGGAKVFRTWIPVALLGSTYTVTRGGWTSGGVGVTSGNGGNGPTGGASTFSSGSVSLSAGGGQGGIGGRSATASGGAGGTATVSGVTATTASGTAGADGGGSVTSKSAADNPNGAAAGGGSCSASASAGGSGGDSTTNVGGAGGTTGSSRAGAGGGGAGTEANGDNGTSGSLVPTKGGDGGNGGGGGGGGAGGTSSSIGSGAGGFGGAGRTVIEWV
ncbi:hypothetical protein [Mycobacterium sp. 48b]|uniref:glycine-rich domain-containing protein n=1 Tax=Mycobacterium sp. 48b TaxID=3400426 RepID=UPI003AAE7D74